MALYFDGQTTLDSEQYDAIAYYRLSKDDGARRESDSIANQRKLIRSFLQNNPNIHLIEEAQDDGYTGTNFDRPGFRSVLNAIQSKRVNCVIVKDDCVIIEPTQKDLENQGFVAGSICF